MGHPAAAARAGVARDGLHAERQKARARGDTCTCPECGKGFRQEISVPDHGARIKAVETLLREGLGRVGEADVIEPKMPTSVDEAKNLSWDELNLVFAMTHVSEIRAVVERGDDALRTELEKWAPRRAGDVRPCPRRGRLTSAAICLRSGTTSRGHRTCRLRGDA